MNKQTKAVTVDTLTVEGRKIGQKTIQMGEHQIARIRSIACEETDEGSLLVESDNDGSPILLEYWI